MSQIVGQPGTTQPATNHKGNLARVLSPWVIVSLLAALHFVVDTVAGSINPLWPVLEQKLALSAGGLLWVFVVWTLATSFGQLLFAIWADRRSGRWFIWVGPTTAILCISCLGFAESSLSVALLIFLGGLGIAAFHPEAAAIVGSQIPEQRSRAMGVFALCGYLGQSFGPSYSGVLTDRIGVDGLVWGIAWQLPAVFVLALFAIKTPPSAIGIPDFQSRHQPRMRLSLAVPLLLTVGVLRILPAMGIPLVLAYILESNDAPSSVVGGVQSTFMIGFGLGAMACAGWIRKTWEHTSLWLLPLCATPCLAILPLLSGWPLFAAVAINGFLLGVTMPVYISYGQQLLPHGQRVASSITMGVSWGISGGLVALLVWGFTLRSELPYVFLVFSVATFFSSLFSLLLPDLRSD